MEENQGAHMRLPFVQRLNDTVRNHFVAFCGEFLGTFFFLFIGLSGAQVALSITGPDDEISRVMYISMSFGFSLAVNVWVMFRVSGGLFNPAVSLFDHQSCFPLPLGGTYEFMRFRSQLQCAWSEQFLWFVADF